jgi:hypothetical protein
MESEFTILMTSLVAAESVTALVMEVESFTFSRILFVTRCILKSGAKTMVNTALKTIPPKLGSDSRHRRCTQQLVLATFDI